MAQRYRHMAADLVGQEAADALLSAQRAEELAADIQTGRAPLPTPAQSRANYADDGGVDD